MEINFFVPGEPQGKARARVVRRGNYIQSYTPENTVNYENLIKVCFMECAKDIEWAVSEKPLKMRVLAVFSIPSSFSRIKANRALEGQLKPLKKPDADNCLKVVADALNKIAYTDDKNIVDMRIIKAYGTTPGLEINIKEISE